MTWSGGNGSSYSEAKCRTMAAGVAAIGRQEFKFYNAASNNWYPGGANSWYIHQGGSVAFRYYSATGETEVVDGLVPTICAPGEFSGWNNAAPMTSQGYNIWCYNVPTPGTYQWKPTRCGTWDSWTSGGERSADPANWTTTTTMPNEQICVTYFPSNGQVAPGAIFGIPTMSQWGLIVFCLLMGAVGLVTLRQRKLVMSGTQNAGFSFRALPFDKGLFTKALVAVAMVAVAIFTTAVVAFGYEMTTADGPGSLLAIPLVAYIVMLLKEEA